MKHSIHTAHLRIYRPEPPKTTSISSIFTQKNMDNAVITASIFGLLSAMAFLLTMS